MGNFNKEKEEELVHSMIYEMMYGKNKGKKNDAFPIDFNEFKETLKIALDSETAEEFEIRSDLFCLENEKLKKIVLEKKFGDGKEQEKTA